MDFEDKFGGFLVLAAAVGALSVTVGTGYLATRAFSQERHCINNELYYKGNRGDYWVKVGGKACLKSIDTKILTL